jgi:nucleoside-triphosphatase THEP1
LPQTGPVVLCGEPGIGKSTELASIRASLETGTAADGGSCCWVIFREVADFAEFGGAPRKV